MNFGVSGEILFIMLLALILFGPRRMPEIARQVGRFMADFKNAGDTLQKRLQDELRALDLDNHETLDNLTTQADEAQPVSPASDLSEPGVKPT